MKTILTATAIAVMTAGFASAMTSSPQLIDGVQKQLDVYVSGVDVHALSDAQIVALHFALTSEDRESDKKSAIRSILN